VDYGNGRTSVPVPDLLIRPPQVLGQRMQLSAPIRSSDVPSSNQRRPEKRRPADDGTAAGTVVRTRCLEPLVRAIGVVQGVLGC